MRLRPRRRLRLTPILAQSTPMRICAISHAVHTHRAPVGRMAHAHLTHALSLADEGQGGFKGSPGGGEGAEVAVVAVIFVADEGVVLL